jgi:aspartyl-tRNA synthetase
MQRKRMLGGLMFVDLRDHYGVTQIVFKGDGQNAAIMDELGPESVVSISGTVVAREEGTVNPKLPTGEIELRGDGILVLSKVSELPMPVVNRSGSGEPEQDEETRLRHRYLDLRKPRVHANIKLRSEVIRTLREGCTSKASWRFRRRS